MSAFGLRLSDNAEVAAVLDEHVPAPVLSFLLHAGCRIQALAPGERFADVSPALQRIGVDVDAWPVPPAGLTVVEEKTIYVRDLGAMTVVHETGHLLDVALGGGIYRSGFDPDIRSAFSNARRFVTPYAATGLDEYFAEAFRAVCEANDEVSPWPRATVARLEDADAPLAAMMARIVADPVRFAEGNA